MMLPIRRLIFGIAGGFMITDFYVNCVNVSDINLDSVPTWRIESPRESNSNSSWSIMGSIFRQRGATSNTRGEISIASPREDLEAFIKKNSLPSALIVCALVSFGGFWSLLGSASAIAFDGDDGVDRYTAVKEWLRS